MYGYKNDYGLDKKFSQFRDLRELIRYGANSYGQNTAFKIKVASSPEGNTYEEKTYRDFFRDMERLGSALTKRCQKGDRVAIVGRNSYNWILADVTIACGIGVVVPLDASLAHDDLEAQLIRSGATAIFYDKEHQEAVADILMGGKTALRRGFTIDFRDEMIRGAEFIEDLLNEGEKILNKNDFTYMYSEIDPDALAFIQFTPGNAKAVMLSHANLMSCNWGFNCEEYFPQNDIAMITLPLHDIFSFMGMITFVSQGIVSVFCDGPDRIIDNMKEYQITVFQGTPEMVRQLYDTAEENIEQKGKRKSVERRLRICAFFDRFNINLREFLLRFINESFGGTLRFIISSVSAPDPVVQETLTSYGILTVHGYGLTEAASVISCESYRYIKHGSSGKVMPNMIARIDDPDDSGYGKLVIKGDNVMLGYLDDPQETARVLDADGWLMTDDIGMIDKDGFLFIA